MHPTDDFPRLVADIGGTSARFGLIDGPGAAVRDVVGLPCAEFPGPEEAALEYLDRAGLGPGARPPLAAFAVAAPVHDDPVRMTNSHWVIARRSVAERIGARRLWLLNDFEALALALPMLGSADVRYFGGGQPDRHRTMAVIGPGTGLGVAVCVPAGDRWVAVAGEGGHVTASAADDFEAEVLRRVRAEFDHVSAERLLSGIGLPLLHRAVCEVRARPVQSLSAEQISHGALHGGDEDCRHTLDTFCAMLGAFAGNVALTVGARGGVYIAGGIAPRLADYFARSRLRERFEAKGRFRGYLQGIATGIVVAPYPALIGAAQGMASALQLQADR